MYAFETFKFKLQSLAFRGFSGCSIGSKASYDCGVLRVGCPWISKVKGNFSMSFQFLSWNLHQGTVGLWTKVSRVNVKMGDHEAAVQVPCCIFTLQLGRPTGFSEGVCCYVAWMSRTYPSGSTRGLRVGERCTVFLESFSNMFPKQTCHFVTRLSSFEGHCYLPTTWGRQKSSIGFL